MSCHTRQAVDPPGALVLDDLDSTNGFPGDYARLARDDEGASRWGFPPLVSYAGDRLWRGANASRYVRRFQSRRSLLVWKVFGRRLDGWTNEDHPTESVPGDPATLPGGATINQADLDFTGDIMPPPGSGVPALTADEKMTIARWIDLGCPINLGAEYGSGDLGWFLDEIRPALTVSLPRPGTNSGPLAEIRFGMADANSGIDPASLSVTAGFPVAGRPAGAELADLAHEAGDGISTIALGEPLLETARAELVVQVADRQGNVTRVARRFSVGFGAGCTPAPRSCTSGPAALRLVRKPGGSKLSWRWRGSATTFGDPTRSTGYAVCLYDETSGSPGRVMEIHVAAGARWKGGRGGFRYRDRRAAAAGVTMVELTSGPASAAEIRVRGRGAALPLPLLPLAQDTAVTVQLVRDDAADCWQAVFPAPARKNTRRQFMARAR